MIFYFLLRLRFARCRNRALVFWPRNIAGFRLLPRLCFVVLAI